MNAAGCHAQPSQLEEARQLIQKTLGVKRVADWCAVSEDAVYQWLSRGTDVRPIPVERAICVHAAAMAAGMGFDLRRLWPGAPAPASEPGSPEHAEAVR